MIAGLAVASMDAFCAAVVNLLGPLRLGADGWSVQAIAVPILLGSALGWSLASYAGRLSDRVGPVRVALVPGHRHVGAVRGARVALSSPLVLFSVFVLGPLFAFQATAVYPLCTRGADELGVAARRRQRDHEPGLGGRPRDRPGRRRRAGPGVRRRGGLRGRRRS